MTCIHCGSHNHENFPFCGFCGKNLQITLNCDSCGEETPAEAMFCGSCGISFSQTFSCDSCGEENPSESLFCGSCGTTFETFEQKDSINNYRRQPHDFWTQIFQYPPKYFWVLLICVLIGGLLIWGLYSNQLPRVTTLLKHISPLSLLDLYNEMSRLRLLSDKI